MVFMLQPQFRSARTLLPNQMKPNSQISRQLSRHDRRPTLPVTDYSFHPASGLPTNRGATHPPGAGRVLARRFRQLSSDFLGRETTRDYVVELLLFTIIVSVSAWPMASMLRALAQLTK
jgi:hypothetical protein